MGKKTTANIHEWLEKGEALLNLAALFLPTFGCEVRAPIQPGVRVQWRPA